MTEATRTRNNNKIGSGVFEATWTEARSHRQSVRAGEFHRETAVERQAHCYRSIGSQEFRRRRSSFEGLQARHSAIEDLRAAFHKDFRKEFEQKEGKMARDLAEIRRLVAGMNEFTKSIIGIDVVGERASRQRLRTRSADALRSKAVASAAVGSSSTDSTPCSSPGPQFRISSRTFREDIVQPGSPKFRSAARFDQRMHSKFATGCYLEKRVVHTRFSSTVTLKIGSTMRCYTEEVQLQSRMVPTRFTEGFQTPFGTATKCFSSRLEIECARCTETVLPLPQPCIYSEHLPLDTRTPVFI